jgi:hypothetical protein
LRRIYSISGFFEEYITFWKIRLPKRLIVPLIIILLAKVAGGVFIANSLNIQSLGTFWSDPNRVYTWSQDKVFLANPGATGNWPLTFLGWDSAWYLSIMTKGYSISSQSYSFSPAFPFFSEMTNFVLQSPMVSIVLTGLVFGVLWIPLYQSFAEEYMSKKAALLSALLLAFSPYLFVFTTVAYSEGLLLFFTLGAWLLFKKNKPISASVLACIAPLTRTMGVLVVLPMLYGSLKKKTHKGRHILLSLLPIASLTVWFAGIGFFAGDFFAPIHTSEWSQLYTFRSLLTEGIPRYGVRALMEAPYQPSPIPTHWLLPLSIVSALIFPLLMFWGTWKKDKALWIYAIAGYGGILYFGALVSTPRFISVLFPLWIPLTASFSGNKKSVAIAAIITVSFYIIALDLWTSFLKGQFVA